MLKIVDEKLKGFCFACAEPIELKPLRPGSTLYRSICEGCGVETFATLQVPLEKMDFVTIIVSKI